MRVLIGACGGLTGFYLTKMFKHSGHTVVGFDIDDMIPTKFFLDDFFILPSAVNDNFVEHLCKELVEREIQCYIPTHSMEIRMISRNEEHIRSIWDGYFIVSPFETFLKLDNKRNANQSLKEIGITVPRLYDDADDINYPIFMKPDIGSAGKQSLLIENEILYKEYKRIYPRSSFYEYIQGNEYTVDCFFDEKGRLIGYNQRARKKSMGGAVVISQNDYSFDILPYLRMLEKHFRFRGCINFQYILKGQIPYFIDINLRFPAGGLALSIDSGLDVVGYISNMACSKDIPEWVECDPDGRIMYRYFTEIYEDIIDGVS